MTFFTLNRKKDCSIILFSGIIFTAMILFVYPAPALFVDIGKPDTLLLYNIAAGITFLIITAVLILFADDSAPLTDKLCIAMPDRKTLAAVFSTLPFLLAAVAAITWHWKFTLKDLEIPFEEKQFILQYADIKSPGNLILLTVMTVLIAPPVEELLFRRVTFSLTAKFTTPNVAGFITAGVFSVAHNFTAGIPGLFLMGLAFQWLFSKTSNLAAPILLHMLCNAVAIIFACIQ